MEPINRLSELIEDWKFYTQRDGLRSAILAIGSELARLPYRHLQFVILARSLIQPLPDPQPKVAIEIRPFTQVDPELARLIDRPSEARLCARRLDRGHKGLFAFIQDKPAGYAWGCSEVDPDLERVRLKLELGDVLCTDVYTTPVFRGQGVQTALTLARFRLFRDLGFRRAISYIEVNNGPSLAVWQRKLGSMTIGEVDFLRIGPWYRVRFNWIQSTGEPGGWVTHGKIPNTGL
jgi:GNAT superfamily N-acetyltransferase